MRKFSLVQATTGKNARKHGPRRAPPTSTFVPSAHPFVSVVGPLQPTSATALSACAFVSVVGPHLKWSHHGHERRADDANADGGARVRLRTFLCTGRSIYICLTAQHPYVRQYSSIASKLLHAHEALVQKGHTLHLMGTQGGGEPRIHHHVYHW